MGDYLETEPAAQLLLRNLLHYAMRHPTPPRYGVVRFALLRGEGGAGLPPTLRDPAPEDLAEALALVSVAVPENLAGLAGGDLRRLLTAGCPAVFQSEFSDEAIAALNRLLAALWPQAPPQFAAASLQWPDGRRSMNYYQKLLWGLSAEMLATAAPGEIRAPVPSTPAPGFKGLTHQSQTDPDFLSLWKRCDARIACCPLPLDGVVRPQGGS